MNILVIPVQSVSDLITNSSSEVFILETSKIKTHLYPPESLSKNVILTKDKVQITPSSFNLTPIKVIHV